MKKEVYFLKIFLLCFFGSLLFSCARQPKVELDPESQAFYEYARLIMTSEENKIFSRLKDEASRREFIEEFWAKRDPDPETEENEFKNEFFRRIDYANKHFREGTPGWKTDRGRVYIFMGPPDKFEEFHTHHDPEVRGSILWWIYYDYELGIEFVDRNGMSHFEIRSYTGDFFGAMEKMKLGQVGTSERGLKPQRIDFDLRYAAETGEIQVSLPLNAFQFIRQGDEVLARLFFDFYIYHKDGRKVQRFQQERELRRKEEELTEKKTADFVFSTELEPGDYYIDCLVFGQEGTLRRVRQIFEVKVEKRFIR